MIKKYAGIEVQKYQRVKYGYEIRARIVSFVGNLEESASFHNVDQCLYPASGRRVTITEPLGSVLESLTTAAAFRAEELPTKRPFKIVSKMVK
jgi:hypothetical protein